MYILERLVFQGSERCPQYLWKQLAMCQNRAPLERVRMGQRRSEDWRITEMTAAPNTIPRGKKSA
jgi:hypothetical protein